MTQRTLAVVKGADAQVGVVGRRPAPADVALATCLVAISVLVASQATGRSEPGAGAPTAWWEWAVVVAPSVAVAFRRSAPQVATPVAVAGQMLIWGLDLAEVFVAPLVLIYSVVVLGGRRGRHIGLASSIALSAMAAVGIVVAPDVGVDVFALTVLSSSAVLIVGINAASHQRDSAQLAVELAVAELEHEAVRERAVVRERERIAQELHDLVGHSLSVIAVRAEAAQRVGDERPDVARDAIAAIGDVAHSSLVEVRRVLHAVQSTIDVELSPLPSLADLGPLVDRVSAAGVDVDFLLSGSADRNAVSAAAGAGVYRIVQESLTNVMKHAGPSARAFVEVNIDNGFVHVSIDDDGPRREEAVGTGLGLVGMSERARFLGGCLDAGPVSNGGFRVCASIPTGGPS